MVHCHACLHLSPVNVIVVLPKRPCPPRARVPCCFQHLTAPYPFAPLNSLMTEPVVATTFRSTSWAIYSSRIESGNMWQLLWRHNSASNLIACQPGMSISPFFSSAAIFIRCAGMSGSRRPFSLVDRLPQPSCGPVASRLVPGVQPRQATLHHPPGADLRASSFLSCSPHSISMWPSFVPCCWPVWYPSGLEAGPSVAATGKSTHTRVAGHMCQFVGHFFDFISKRVLLLYESPDAFLTLATLGLNDR